MKEPQDVVALTAPELVVDQPRAILEKEILIASKLTDAIHRKSCGQRILADLNRQIHDCEGNRYRGENTRYCRDGVPTYGSLLFAERASLRGFRRQALAES